MRISEMIEALEQAKGIHGDIHIWGRDESGRLSYVESLVFFWKSNNCTGLWQSTCRETLFRARNVA